ncbi:PQQ-dependent sugar dehydrogenase [soil metagenome]
MKNLPFYAGMLILAIVSYSCKQAKGKPDAKTISAVPDSNFIKLQMITDALTAPVQMSIPPDRTNRRFITDNAGKIWIMKQDSILPQPFLDVSTKPVKKDKEVVIGKIYSMTFHPQFATNHKLYVCYNAAPTIPAHLGKLTVSEFTPDANNTDVADIKSEHRVFEMEGYNSDANGAEIAFGPDGYLYISIGDIAMGDSTYVYHGQDLNYFNGKMLRIDVNKTPYAIPPDNPFVGKKNERPEIWAYGFRKIWRFCFDPKSGSLFGGDVGEEKAEEINIVQKGANYGWPVLEGDSIFTNDKTADKKTFATPICEYTHKDGTCVIGGGFYLGKAFPFLHDKYVFADFTSGLFSLTNNAQGQWAKQALNIRNKPTDPFLICGINADENNELYVMGILNTMKGSHGVVYKIVKE